jgi:hypothetical protein
METAMLTLNMSTAVRTALLFAGLLSFSLGSASAATAAGSCAGTAAASADCGADMTAKADLNRAINALNRQHVKSGRNQLERAETALLNREAADLGETMARPLPTPPPIDDIVKARIDLEQRHVPQAVSDAKQAVAAVDADLATLTSR